ncbi:hypothetical protein HYS95_02085 [Candidatus Daviesbacteria bacterium]|nr:hypothetical protein [Candidatus Daviesbacteria bacterium]
MNLARFIEMGVIIGTAAGMSPAEYSRVLLATDYSVRKGSPSYGKYRSAMAYSGRQHPTSRLFNRRIMDR